MIVAFYAYKGGTGRSAAVANIAPVLSRAGYRVIVVDLDLDAPGLHRFFGRSDADTCAPPVRGFVELCLEYKAALARAASGADPAFRPLQWDDLLAPAGAEDVEVYGPRALDDAGLEAWVRILPAGAVDAGFHKRSQGFDWARLYAGGDWQAFFTWLRAELARLADVVFIDARTGVTDIGALAISALADRVVLLTPPTSQGLDGAMDTARALRTRRGLPFAGMLVPARISDEAYPDHWNSWLREAKAQATAADLADFWVPARGLDKETAEREIARMIEHYKLPEVPLHSIGEPLVKRRMIEWNRREDRLQDAYERLGAEIHRWVAQAGREQAKVTGAGLVEVRSKIEAARREKDRARLPWLRLEESEVLLRDGNAEEAERAAQIGLGNAEAASDDVAAVSLLLAEGRAASDIDRRTQRVRAAVLRAGELDDSQIVPRVQARLALAEVEMRRPDMAAAAREFAAASELCGQGTVSDALRARVRARTLLCELLTTGTCPAAAADEAAAALLAAGLPREAARFHFWRVFARMTSGTGPWPAQLSSRDPSVRASVELGMALRKVAGHTLEQARTWAQVDGEAAVEAYCMIQLGYAARNAAADHLSAAAHWCDEMVAVADSDPELVELSAWARAVRIEVLDRLSGDPAQYERLLCEQAEQVRRVRPFYAANARSNLGLCVDWVCGGPFPFAAASLQAAEHLATSGPDWGQAWHLAAKARLTGDAGVLTQAIAVARSTGSNPAWVSRLEVRLSATRDAAGAEARPKSKQPSAASPSGRKPVP